MKRLALFALFVVACAQPDPGRRATMPHPAMPATVVGEDLPLIAGDGLELYARRWVPASATRVGALVIVHGLKDHSDRYSAMVAAAVEAGYAVYALDLRGHGRSPGPRVTIDRFDRYVDDVARLVERALADTPNVPVFVLGHSMGGVITARLVQTRDPGVSGVILSAPALGLDAPAFQAASVVASGGPGLGGVPGFEPPTKQFASRREVTDDMARDPLIHNAKAPVRTAAELLRAMGQAWEDVRRIHVPILILHGTGDTLTAPAASRDFLRQVVIADRTLLLYEGAWHDLAHEPAAPQINADVIAWMDAKRGGVSERPAPLPDRKLKGERLGMMQRTYLRGARVVDGGATSLDATVGFAIGRKLMIGATVEGRLGLNEAAGNALFGALGVGTRLGTAGWVQVGGGYATLAGLTYAIGHGELAIAPRQLPVALHLRALITRNEDYGGRVETEAALRFPGNEIFWGRGRRGGGLTLGARTLGGGDAFAITLGLETTGFD